MAEPMAGARSLADRLTAFRQPVARPRPVSEDRMELLARWFGARTLVVEDGRALVIERRLHAIGEADLVLAVYNPASKSRVTQVAELQKILLEHRSPDAIVVVGRDVGRSEESLAVTTLAELDADTVDMKCLLIIGSSTTRVTEGGKVWTPRRVRDD